MKLNSNRILLIYKAIFSIGGFSDGYETSTVIIEGDNASMTVTHSLSAEKSTYLLDKVEFFTGLKALYMEDWEQYYMDSEILDGTQWSLELYFTDKKQPVKFVGSNAYPDNFVELEKLFGVEGK